MSSFQMTIKESFDKKQEAMPSYCQAIASKPVLPPKEGKTRVAVAMSGGVDSSTTALILQKAGFDVVGITGWLIKSGSRCCDTGMIDAARVCEQLEIEHHAVDLRTLFREQIVNQFHQSYAQARTPLPCSLCNTVIKWGALLNYSQKILKASYMATGHYAQIIRTESQPKLARAKDRTKDQSYVLWGLSKEELAATLLPLGEYTKTEIRKMADQATLASAKRPDSQDLCFIPQGTSTQEYLGSFLGESPGPFVHALTGKVLGEHKGTHNFTIGQRKGIGIAHPTPLYVSHIDFEARTVFVGPKESLLRSELLASQMNWIMEPAPNEPFEALAKIRYNSPTVKAKITPLPDKQTHVEFHEKQSAVTPGQVLAIYDQSDTYVLGGGWID